MRYVRDNTGRFAERPHYEPKELDTLFEKEVSQFLKTKHGKVEFPISTDDLTVLIEQRVEDLDVYADLSSYGNGVEGVTEFRTGKKPTVRIAEALSNSDTRENRLRTTLTHEYGHVHLHAYLYELKASSPGLFDSRQKQEVIACKRDTMISANKTDWMEWQAGYACGALLMPATYVNKATENYRKDAGLFGPTPATSEHGTGLINLVVDAFQVSTEAARVRLSVLGILGIPAAGSSLF